MDKTIIMKKSTRRDTTTVGELRKALKGIPADYIVLTEGCDCIGDACSLDIDDTSKEVMINR